MSDLAISDEKKQCGWDHAFLLHKLLERAVGFVPLANPLADEIAAALGDPPPPCLPLADVKPLADAAGKVVNIGDGDTVSVLDVVLDALLAKHPLLTSK